ncbi:MAG: hypothetical protein CR967_05130 [Proteobacteria bacterium]|nr:MAG: hypothetical protein CR967_05130 [Pseudomonadota bacterium]
MIIQEIQQFAQARYKARAYMCYLFNRNVPNNLPEPSLDAIVAGLEKIADESTYFEALYVLDSKGKQIFDNISLNDKNITGMGKNRENRAYYYRAIKEKRCVITDPYPSTLTNELTVTASTPVYNDKKELLYVACIDISLSDLLKIIAPTSTDFIFGKSVEIIYGLFSFALFLVALALFYHGVESMFSSVVNLKKMNVKEMFESTIILTLALAIFDLVKTIFEEEVLERRHTDTNSSIHKTMVRFLGSIIIALAIEALMLVFKFAMTEPQNILHAVYLLGGVTMLLIGLSVYLVSIKTKEERPF